MKPNSRLNELYCRVSSKHLIELFSQFNSKHLTPGDITIQLNVKYKNKF